MEQNSIERDCRWNNLLEHNSIERDYRWNILLLEQNSIERDCQWVADRNACKHVSVLKKKEGGWEDFMFIFNK